MIRCRFEQPTDDPRPIIWPIKHPYWITGQGGDYSIIVAYADDEEEVMRQWPEARSLESQDAASYTFTDRFPKPDWMEQSNDTN